MRMKSINDEVRRYAVFLIILSFHLFYVQIFSSVFLKLSIYEDDCSLVEVYRRFKGACCLHCQALMMAAASTSETSVNIFQTTRRNDPEDSHLHTRRRENLKSHPQSIFSFTFEIVSHP
jgi:hypothetical protein